MKAKALVRDVGTRTHARTHTHTNTYTHTRAHTHSGTPMERVAKMRRAHAVDLKDGITYVLALPVFSVVLFHSSLFLFFLFLLYYSFSFMVLTQLALALAIFIFLSIANHL